MKAYLIEIIMRRMRMRMMMRRRMMNLIAMMITMVQTINIIYNFLDPQKHFDVIINQNDNNDSLVIPPGGSNHF